MTQKEKQMAAETTDSEATEEDTSAGASFHDMLEWHGIQWYRTERNVRRLQARIVQATQEKRWGKVKALQRLLTHSFSGKALAVRRVTENQGKKTPGVDKILWDTPEKKAQAIHNLKPRGYHPQPLRRVYIPKSNGAQRPLSIPTMRDRAMQALYLLALQPVAETLADPHSYGFRPERCTADALVYCHTLLSQRQGAEWVLEGDIKSCFDKISHDWLLAHIPMEKTILRKWLKAGYMEKNVLHLTEEGTPQGGIISPTIANMVLDGLSQFLLERFPRSKQGNSPKVNLARYADDFVVTGASKELLEQEVKPSIELFLKERGLQLSSEKTVVTHIKDGFDFLGQHVRKYKSGAVLTTPSKKNVKTFLKKVRGIIEKLKDSSAGQLIVKLNPVIRGWANYHRFGASKKTFNSVDNAIFKKVWWWARRRHPRKSATWVKQKYFTTQGTFNWVFTGEVKDEDGHTKFVHLRRADAVKIQRHTSIQGAANPFDPAWETYFEKRLDVKTEQNLTGKRQLLHLWKEQNGKCPMCNQRITKITGWHSHHVIWRSKGGTDRVENRVLLHPNCHAQLHSQGLHVEKPHSVDQQSVRKA
ncbi:group II intron reverse transcriptase/maturase [Dictyobacter aurantiacus]|uniref:Group II intron reverse transcriptase/maturase n=1 Tax=Dictyobacter aurantiacus TaxID=1936993 RepID=A0A401ZRP0_9CHLR|nr:group II intron reverse transcriptase/maturase [Dictyobacter aurantiacus]GCE09440.1 group II intron reverse transcriptase/maturase [Dictyobacter aurantiacus]